MKFITFVALFIVGFYIAMYIVVWVIDERVKIKLRYEKINL
jgi:hypothetical protein